MQLPSRVFRRARGQMTILMPRRRQFAVLENFNSLIVDYGADSSARDNARDTEGNRIE